MRIRILVVDDDPGDYLMIKEYLEKSDRATFVTDHVINKADALAALTRTSFDVVLLDYHLGGENGVEVGQEILRLGYRIPLVLLTGYGDPKVHEDALDAGFQDYLLKNRLTPELLVRSMLWCGDTSDPVGPDALSSQVQALGADLRQFREDSKSRHIAHAASIESLRQEVAKALVKEPVSSWWLKTWEKLAANPVPVLVTFMMLLLVILLVVLGAQSLDPELVKAIRK